MVWVRTVTPVSDADLIFVFQVAEFPAAWDGPAYRRHLHGGLEWSPADDDTEGT